MRGDLSTAFDAASDSELGEDDFSIREARCFFHRRKIGVELGARKTSVTTDVSQEGHEHLVAYIKNKLSIKECISYIPGGGAQTRVNIGSPCYCGAMNLDHYGYTSPIDESISPMLGCRLGSADPRAICSPSPRDSRKLVLTSAIARTLLDKRLVARHNTKKTSSPLPISGRANFIDASSPRPDLLLRPYSQLLTESGASSIGSAAFHNVNASDWNESTAIKEVPCNSFGEIEFASDEAHTKPAKYVRLSNSTPISDVVELMTNGWKMLESNRPSLVISVIGGGKNFKFDGDSREVFNHGLVRAAHATNAWLITSGSNMGVMKAVGEAVREGHTVAFGGSRMNETLTCIGVAHWGTVQSRKDLISSDGDGCWPATYHVDPVIREGKPASLDPNHTHFILVDDGYSKYVRPTVAEFRAKLEQKIAANEDGGLGVPVVVVLIEGGLDALDAICEYLKCRIPVVICQGTGRAADILSYAKLSCVEEIDLTTGKISRSLAEEHRIVVMQMLTEAYSGSMKVGKRIVQEKLAEILQRVELCCQEDDLITLCDIDSNEDLDLAILTALLDGQGTRPIDQLHLALKWNRADVASDRIFPKYGSYENGELEKLMTEALATNKVDFVRLLLLRGVDIKNYLTVNRLRYLYNTCPPGSFIYILLGSVAHKRTKYFLCDVKVVLEQQIGKKMDDVYALDSEEATQSHLDRQKKSVESIAYNDASFDKPFKELFFWAVLVNRPRLARFFWECTDHPVMNALVASKIYGSMSERANGNANSHLADHFVKLARRYEALAKHVIDQAYEFDSDKALLIVEMPHEKWDQLNCMQMAALAINKSFMASTCSQMWLDQVWRLGVKCTGLEVVIGILCPFYVLFRMQFDESIIGATRKKLSLYQRYKVFIASPIAKFSTFTVSWIVFLTLYSYVVVFALRPGTMHYPEMVLHIWVASLFIDKIRMALIFLLAKDGETRYLASSLLDLFWTPFFYKVDMVLLGLHAAGCCLRGLPPESFDVTRVVFCLAAATAFSRLFRVYMAHPYLGPKLFVIRQMLADVIMFLTVLVVFMLAYSVCAQALLFPDRHFYWGIFIDTFYYPYWQLYGELSLDNTIEGNLDGCDGNVTMNARGEWCPRRFWPVAFLLGIYLLVGNILLVNLLIAIFSHVFEDVHLNSLEIWKFEMFGLSTEFAQMPILPPPLTIIENIYDGLAWLLFCRRRNRIGDSSTMPLTQRQRENLVAFEKECMNEYNKRIEVETLQQTTSRMQSVSEKLEKVVKELKSEEKARQLRHARRKISSSSQDDQITTQICRKEGNVDNEKVQDILAVAK
uniref:Uncharacterized protein n=1 Tax=Plectus sambesii TaxID=2011161 RepID=A0A914VVE5_9BILA